MTIAPLFTMLTTENLLDSKLCKEEKEKTTDSPYQEMMNCLRAGKRTQTKN
jgi:hypothetical protein